MHFKEVFPEMEAAPPTVVGEMPQQMTPLHRMRRQQLVDLARAYEIPLSNPDAPKPKLLPVLMNAMDEGVFRQPPKHPYYLQKAARTSDDSREPIPAPDYLFHQEAVQEPVQETVAAPPEQTTQVKRTRKPSAWNLMQREARSLGIDIIGKKRTQLEAEIAERKGLRQGNDLGEDQAGGRGSLDDGARGPLEAEGRAPESMAGE